MTVRYHKTGLLVLRDERILLCRKRGLADLILPGGRFERGESPEQCLARELREELGGVRALDLRFLGTYTGRAAGDPEGLVLIELYGGELDGAPAASSEIEALVWFGEHDDRSALAPSLVNAILPDLIARGVLPWRA